MNILFSLSLALEVSNKWVKIVLIINYLLGAKF